MRELFAFECGVEGLDGEAVFFFVYVGGFDLGGRGAGPGDSGFAGTGTRAGAGATDGGGSFGEVLKAGGISSSFGAPG